MPENIKNYGNDYPKIHMKIPIDLQKFMVIKLLENEIKNYQYSYDNRKYDFGNMYLLKYIA
jgi:hypothetical protein